MVAKDIRVFRSLSKKLVKIEERSSLLGNLIVQGVGLKEEEEFLVHEQAKFKSDHKFKRKKDVMKLTMLTSMERRNVMWMTCQKKTRRHMVKHAF